MNAKLCHYEELEDHRAYFKQHYGRAWEAPLVRAGCCSLSEINGLLHKDSRGFIAPIKRWSKLILPRLRAHRAKIEASRGQLSFALSSEPQIPNAQPGAHAS